MSLVAWWPLNGTAEARVGPYNGNGSNVNYGSGKFGQCFDNTAGNDTGIELLTATEMDEYENYYSFSYWFKSTTTSGNQYARVSSRDYSEGTSVLINQTQSSPQDLRLNDITGTDRTSVSNVVTVNEWHHLAYTIDLENKKSKLYIDGTLLGSGSTSPQELDSPLGIMSNVERSTNYSASLEGKIDDVRLYDHALSEKEVTQLSRGKVLHYKFDDAPLDYSWYDTQELYDSNGYAQTESELDNFFDASRSDVSFGGSGAYTDSVLWGDSGQTTVWGDSTNSKPSYLPADGYSWKAGGAIYAPESGTYQFDLDGDDGCDVFVGGTKVADYYGGHGFGDGANTYSTDLTEGYHSFVARMQEGGGGDGIGVAWNKPSDSGYSTIPASRFSSTGNAQDVTGRGNTGTNNGATFTEDSVIGSGAYDFDGPDTVAYVGNSLNLSEITLSSWVRPEDMSNQYAGVVGSNVKKAYNDFLLRRTNSDKYQFIVDWDKIQPTFPASELNEGSGEWHHLAATFDGETAKLYLDGVERSSQTDSSATLTDNGIKIGSYYDGSYQYSGGIDDVRIYARALSSQEVQSLYEQRASIDAGGNFYAHEIDDTHSANSLTEDGEMHSGEVNEVGPAADSLVGWWPLDGDAKDYAGTNDGTVNGATVTSGLGQNAYDFDGTDDYINTPNSLISGLPAITISTWVKITQSPTEYDGIVHNKGGSADQDIGIMAEDNGTYHVEITTDTGNNIDPSGGSLNLNSWELATLTWSSSTGNFNFYVNGSNRMSNTVPGNAVADPNYSGTTIGKRTDQQDYLGGQIQDVRIYDRALTEDEVQQLYQLTDPRDETQVAQSETGELFTENQISELL